MRECSKISDVVFYGSLFTLVERQHSLVVQQCRAFRPVLLDFRRVVSSSMEDNEMLTPVTPIAKKMPIAPPRLAVEATEFHIERRKSYYKVQYFDLDGKSQTVLIGRELFTNPSRVVGLLLKANADLPDNPVSAVRLVMHALANRSKRSRRITMRTGWHGTSFVYPGGTFGPLAGKLEHEGADEIDPALGLKQGTLEAWREGLRNVFEASDYLIFAASVAFSGPLFDLASEQEGIVFIFNRRFRASKPGIENEELIGQKLGCASGDIDNWPSAENGSRELRRFVAGVGGLLL